MASRYSIRTASPGDEEGINALLQASYPALMRDSYDEAVLAAALPLMVRANQALLFSGTFYVAETDEGSPIGCGGWTRERPGTEDIRLALGHIRHFATHPAWTGRGIGRAIFETCAYDARDRGVEAFECYASLNAEPFYRALGFKPARRLDVALSADVHFPAILMRRLLDADQ